MYDGLTRTYEDDKLKFHVTNFEYFQSSFSKVLSPTNIEKLILFMDFWIFLEERVFFDEILEESSCGVQKRWFEFWFTKRIIAAIQVFI